jgi:ABC-type polysaccharide/polyol phosphate export permease
MRFIQLAGRLARKYLLVKYKNSALGLLWSLINPLLLLAVFSIIFSRAFPQVENYTLFALGGIVLWNFFPGTLTMLINILPDNAPLLRSYPVPPLVFPMAALLTALIHFGLLLIPLGVLMLLLGWKPATPTAVLLPGMLLFAIFCLGLGLMLGTLNIFFRDVALLWNTLIPALFYFTPVVYPPDLVPEHLRSYLWLNPIAWYVLPLRDALTHGVWPDWHHWLGMSGWAIGISALGGFVFHRLKKYFIAFL